MTRLRAVTLAVGFALACSPVPQPETAAPSAAVPVPGGRVVQATFFDAQTLQPLHATDAVSLQATSLLYAPLLRPDPVTGALRPHLGTWSVSADGRTVAWDIDPHAAWSDGTPVTGDDFATLAKAVARSKRTTRKSSFQLIGASPITRAGKPFDRWHLRRRQTLHGPLLGGVLPIALRRVWCRADPRARLRALSRRSARQVDDR